MHIWQLAPSELLRDDLWRTLWYLHSQPPMFNLLTGLLLHRLLLRLALAPWLATLLAMGWVAAPSTMLYQHFWLYDWIAAVLLVVAAYALHRYASGGERWAAWLCFGSLAALSFTMSRYHLVFLLASVAGCWLLLPQHRRRTLTIAAVPVLLVVALYAKNLAVFGSFGASSWMGMSLWHVSSYWAKYEFEGDMSQFGLSELAEHESYQRLARYDIDPAEVETGIPILDYEPVDRSRFSTNFHAYEYIEISRQFQRDSIQLARVYPRSYLSGLAVATMIYFVPASDFMTLRDNRWRMHDYDWLWHYVVLSQLNYEITPDYAHTNHVSLVLLVMLPASLLAAMHAARRATGATRITLLWMICVVLYSAIVGNLLELGENHRFRFPVNAFYLAFFGILVRAWLASWLPMRQERQEQCVSS